MNLFQKYLLLIKSFYGLIGLAKNPQNTKMVFIIGNNQDKLAESFRKEGKIDDPFLDVGVNQLYKESYHPPLYNLNELGQLPSNTLGYGYAHHMWKYNLKPDFYSDDTPLHPMHYLRLRIRKTHDIWHMLTGFNTSQNGEIGLQGFYFAQFSNGQSALILGGGILRAIFRFDYKMVKDYIDFFVKGYNMGKKAKAFLPIKWEEYWFRDLEELRKEFLVDAVVM